MVDNGLSDHVWLMASCTRNRAHAEAVTTRGLFNQDEDDDLHNEVHTEVRANCPHVAHPIRPTGHAWLSGCPHVLEPLSESEMQRVAQYYQFINRPLDQFIDRPLG